MNNMNYIKQFPLRHFTRGTLLASKGDDLTSIMAIRTGYIKITSINEAGIERLVWIAGRYDFAPNEQLFSSRGTCRYFYTALSDGSYYDVSRTDFMNEAAKNMSLMTEIARGMSEHYDDMLQRIDSVESMGVRERLLKTLSYLARRSSADHSVDLVAQGLSLTHQELASMIGSTRETTSSLLSDLRSEGLIQYDRAHLIVNVREIAAVFE